MKRTISIFVFLAAFFNVVPVWAAAEGMVVDTGLSFVGRELKDLSAETALRFVGKGAGPIVTPFSPPLVLGGSAGSTIAGAGDVLDIRLVQARPVGAGVLPFRTSDVRNRINPQAILASSTTSNNGGGGGGGAPTITCPDNTQFPPTGFSNAIELQLPDPAVGGTCALVASPTGSPNRAVVFDTFTSVSGNATAFNGWAVNLPTIIVSIAPFQNNIRVTKNGVSYTFILTSTGDTIGGAQLVITNFARVP